MFLFDYPANKKREEKGQYPINSIWFSGGGKKIKADINSQNKIVFSDLMLLKKIAQLNLEGVKIEPFTKMIMKKKIVICIIISLKQTLSMMFLKLSLKI
jgi:2,3-bisphosphoglycerate-independent phosphoglycerate mutase